MLVHVTTLTHATSAHTPPAGSPQPGSAGTPIRAPGLRGTLRRMDPNVFIFLALESYAVLAALVAAAFVLVLRRTSPPVE
jgi:hypothetical protein